MVQIDRALLRLHIEAVWGVSLPPIETNEILLLPESAQPDWRLFVADLADGRVLVWRGGLESVERENLLALLAEVERLPENVPLPSSVSREVAFRLDAVPEIELAAARKIARLLTADDYALIDDAWPGGTRAILGCQPIGVIIDGRLLSMAHSSRRTTEACEVGIDTLPEARRRGYALDATIVWSAAISAEGLTPIYSALAENTASLSLAVAAGYREFARGLSLK